MLILARKTGESIKIGGDITVEVISVSGNTVKIGIEAPKEVGILRNELYEMIKNENISASTVNLADLAGLNELNDLSGLNNEYEHSDKNKKIQK